MKFYIYIVIVLAIVSATTYTVSMAKDSEAETMLRESVKTANELRVKNNHLEVTKKEDEVVKKFVEIKKEIVRKSVETKNYTKKMMEKKDVEEFTDSF